MMNSSHHDSKALIGPGSKLGKYRIVRELGRGATSTVFLAEHVSLSRQAALKVFLRVGTAWDEALERFGREAEAASKLDAHSNMVRIYDVGEETGIHYIAMEWIDGPSLRERIERGPLPWREATHLCAKIADVLHYAHQKGIIHRDIKPSNILLDSKGEPHLSDFGLARDLSFGANLTESCQVLGTPAYMSPQQACGRTSEVDGRADIFSLGVVLWECITGINPFSRETLSDILAAITHVDPGPPQGVPPDLAAVIIKCLEKEPAARYSKAGILAGDLRRALAGEPTFARPMGPIRRTARFIRQHRRMAILSVASLVALAGAIYGFAKSSKRQQAQAAFERAQVHRAQGRHMDALAEFDKAIELQPIWTAPLLERAVMRQQQGNWEGASADYRRAAEVDPKDTAGSYALGYHAMETKEYEKAVELFSIVLQRDPKHADASHYRGIVLVALKDLSRAEGDFRRAAELDPRWAAPLHELGHLLEGQRRIEEALPVYCEAALREPEHGEIRFHCGVVKTQLGKPLEALEDFDAAIQYNIVNGYLYKADALRDLNRIDEAIQLLENVLRHRPHFHEAQDRLTILRKSQGLQD